MADLSASTFGALAEGGAGRLEYVRRGDSGYPDGDGDHADLP